MILCEIIRSQILQLVTWQGILFDGLDTHRLFICKENKELVIRCFCMLNQKSEGLPTSLLQRILLLNDTTSRVEFLEFV